MAIIRNDRRAREAAERQAQGRRASEDEEELDHSWHPSEEELPDPISRDRWLAMLGDPEVFDEDGLRAVECVNDYGEPVTFQQLSVRYRGTMGRYRRWLAGVAERAARHEGREPVVVGEQDSDGEWWPYLYRQRVTGKAAANVHEMVLQPELAEALALRDAGREEERRRAKAQEEAQARRRSERLGRRQTATRPSAGQSQVPVASDAGAEVPAASTRQQAQPEPAVPKVQASAAPPEGHAQTVRDSAASTSVARVEGWASMRQDAVASAAQPATDGASRSVAPVRPVGHKLVLDPPPRAAGAQATVAEGGQPAEPSPLTAFLETMEEMGSGRPGITDAASAPRPSEDAPLDYAVRYGRRILDALDLVQQGLPGLTVARVAREMGDRSVAELQALVNGTSVPTFAYLDRLCALLFLDPTRLEASDAAAEHLPVFATLRERYGTAGVAPLLSKAHPEEVAFVVDDSPERRGGVIVRISELRYALLERVPVPQDADRYQDPALSSYVRFVRDVDARARESGLRTRSLRVRAAEWDALAAGRLWPGTLCLSR